MSDHSPDDGHRLRCLHCGYDLFGLPANICPECGHPFDPRAAHQPGRPGLARGAAVIAVLSAAVTLGVVIKGSLQEIATWGFGHYACCRGCASPDNEIGVVLLAHVVAAVMLWHARTDRLCRRIVRGALLAMLTSWIAAQVIMHSA